MEPEETRALASPPQVITVITSSAPGRHVLEEIEAASAGAAAGCKGIAGDVSRVFDCFRGLCWASWLLLALPYGQRGN